MKRHVLAIGLSSLIANPLVHADVPRERGPSPCFRVTIHTEAANQALVRQDCDWNFNRTVQAGLANQAETHQTGAVNDNKVRQYRYHHLRSLDRVRRD